MPQKQNDVIYLVKLPKDSGEFPRLLVQATTDRMKKVFSTDRKLGPTHDHMLAGDNPLADTWVQLKHALACTDESSCALLRKPDLQVRRSPLST